MIGSRRRYLGLMRPLLLSVAWLATHCGTRVVYAVDLNQADDAMSGSVADQALDAGGDAMLVDAGDAGAPSSGTQVVWPNRISSANSDGWLVAHHDEITELQPNVLVLDFYNRQSPSDAEQIANQAIAGIAEASRYHGYSNANAPAFVNYRIFKFVDLTDQSPPPNWQYISSTKVPITASGDFSISALFSTAFASNYDVVDPVNPSRHLALCELFERGFINELWLLVGDPARKPPLMLESKQEYDAQNRPIPGMFNPCTGYACLPSSMPHCSVTARIANLDPAAATDCDLVPRSIGVEKMRLAIGYLQDNASDFFNDDFKARYATDFDSWTELAAMGGTTGWCTPWGQACIEYPTETEATGTYPDGGTWDMNPFIQGCGNAHFPPNAQFEWDYTNTTPVRSRCENYGLQMGPSGADRSDVYTSAKAAPSGYTCGGRWQTYLRQNMPGLGNKAYAIDGSPMKNWWPFLFY